MTRTMAAVMLAMAFGVGASTLGACGHRTRTTGGRSLGFTSSINKVSVAVIWPLARTMGEDVVMAGLGPVKVPASAANANRGRLFCVR
jgi:hypothetical protein